MLQGGYLVYALFDKEMFVFPSCEVGDVYRAPLPSDSKYVDVKGMCCCVVSE